MGLKDQAKHAVAQEALRRVADSVVDREHDQQDGSVQMDGTPGTVQGEGAAVPSEAAPVQTDVAHSATGPGRGPDRAAPAKRGQDAESPAEIPRRGWLDIAKRTVREVGADNVPMMAAAIAFAGFLSLFPAMIAGLAIYSLVTDPAQAAQQASDLTAGLPTAAATLLTDQLQAVAGASDGAAGVGLIVSILAALWGASGGMGMLMAGVNTAYDETNDRGFVRNKGLAVGLAFGAIIFFAVAITLVAVVPALLDALGPVGGVLSLIGRWVLLAGLIAVALAVLYRFAPDRADAQWQWLSPGAVVATLLWLVATAAFAFFVDNFGSYNETYGAAAGVVVLLLWLQITAIIVLLGAEFNAEAERQTAQDTTTGPDKPMGQRDAEPADHVVTQS